MDLQTLAIICIARKKLKKENKTFFSCNVSKNEFLLAEEISGDIGKETIRWLKIQPSAIDNL